MTNYSQNVTYSSWHKPLSVSEGSLITWSCDLQVTDLLNLCRGKT